MGLLKICQKVNYKEIKVTIIDQTFISSARIDRIERPTLSQKELIQGKNRGIKLYTN